MQHIGKPQTSTMHLILLLCILFPVSLAVNKTVLSLTLQNCSKNKTCNEVNEVPSNNQTKTTSNDSSELPIGGFELPKGGFELPKGDFELPKGGFELPKGRFELPIGGVLYPRASESRELISLDGIWSFILDVQGEDKKESWTGMREKWFQKDISKLANATWMPVPSSYNDITTSAVVHDHVGLVWYQRTFFVPSSWKLNNQRLWLRFGGVHYLVQVWINGGQVLEHEIGHLPFQGEVTKFVNFGVENNITVSLDNTLGPETVPQGTLEEIETFAGSKVVQKYRHGYFNYAGIHRSVCLYTTPKVYLDDVWLKTIIKSNTVTILYGLFCKGVVGQEDVEASVAIVDKDGQKVGYESQNISDVKKVSGEIEIKDPKLWWPYMMKPDPGYMYTVEIMVKSLKTGITDIYRHPYGLRSIKWDKKSIFINDKPIYIRGISMHEDADIRGRSLDLSTSLRDLNLLKWLGANTYRTSHGPHSEESMDLAERMGFMVINEIPSINTEDFTDNLLSKQKIAISELINRDKNRACVIMWSVGNEPGTEIPQAGPYFGSLVSFTRRQDDTRPVTAVLNRWNTVDQAAQWMDIICFNRYNGQFKEPGQWEIIKPAVEKEASYWNTRHNKPVIMSEYGSDAFEGLHGLPECLWTERFQQRVLSEHFRAFDNLTEKGWFVGEIVYSFTDFKTDQSPKRVGARHRKGIFTRQRQPKSSAYLLRKRYFRLAAFRGESKLAAELDLYSASRPKKHHPDIITRIKI